MLDLGLTPDQKEAYEAALVQPHQIRIRVSVLDANESELSSLSLPTSQVLDGQVSVDYDQDISRSLSLTVLDPGHRLLFDANSPADGALFVDRFIAVTYGVYVKDTAIADWVDVPIFFGPCTSFARNGSEVTIEAQGKESLMLDPALQWRPLKFRKGERITDVIRSIAQSKGEAKFNIPASTHRLKKALSVSKLSQSWLTIKSLAKDLDRRCIYDGAGYLKIQALVPRAVYTFKDGDAGAILNGPPQVTYDVTELRNTIDAVGSDPPGPRKAPRYVATPSASDPLSPTSLGRNGKPRYLVEHVQLDHARTTAQVKKIAKSLLDLRIREAAQVAFDSFPIPHLEEGDVAAIKTDKYSLEFNLKQFALPLTDGGSMSVGSVKLVRATRRNTW